MIKEIKILGTGCPKCQTLSRAVEDAAQTINFDGSIEKVDDIMEIMKYNVISTPALVVDGEVMVSGRVPSHEEIINILNQ